MMDGPRHTHAKYLPSETNALRPSEERKNTPKEDTESYRKSGRKTRSKPTWETLKQKSFELDGLWRLSTARKGPPMDREKRVDKEREIHLKNGGRTSSNNSEILRIREDTCRWTYGGILEQHTQYHHNHHLAPVMIDHVIHMPNTRLQKQNALQLKEEKQRKERSTTKMAPWSTTNMPPATNITMCNMQQYMLIKACTATWRLTNDQTHQQQHNRTQWRGDR